MIALGLFSLGIFVGTIVTTGVNKIDDWSDPAKVIAAILSSVFAGVILVFINRMAGENLKQSVAYYPLGLVYGLLWYYTPAAIQNLQSPVTGLVVVAWLHIIALALSVVFGGLLLLSPSFRQRLP